MTNTRRSLVAACCLALAAGSALAGEPAGLVARYRGENDTNDSVGTRNGVAQGTVAYAPGAEGQAFSLTGAGYVEVAAPDLDATRTGFTVAAWIRMDSFSSGAPVANFRSPDNTSGFTLEQRFVTDGTILFAVNQSGLAEDFELLDAEGWATGRLYHIAATFDAASGSMVVYRDGQAVGWRHDLPKKPMATAPVAPFQIGHNIRATSFYWNGLIDDVRCYGRALTPSEVASLAAPSPLVAHWRFDEESGTTAHDELGGQDGTMAGGAAFVAGGISGNCVTLDRATNSLVNMGATFPAFTSGDFSVVIWIKATAIAADSLALARHEAFVSNGYIVAVSPTGGGGAAGRATFYASDAQVAQSPISATAIDDGAWHQLVGVYRAGGSHSIFVDGAPVEASTPSAPITDRGAPLLVGGVNENGTPSSRFTGLIDDVQVYASALTDAQIDFLFAHPGRSVSPVRFDLATDWSELANANGAWIYREGVNALPYIASWAGTAEFPGGQPAWARATATPGNPFLPAWFRALGGENFANDWLAGDVVVHTTDDSNGSGSGNANVVWRSPFAGIVDVSGRVWMGRDIGRGVDWLVYRNGTLLTQGNVASGDAFDRAHPFALAAGSGGAAALHGIAVAPNDEIRLEMVRSSSFGDFAGASFSVGYVPETNVVSYLLPKSVKLSLKGDGKDSLSVSGFFDDGGLAIDPSRAVTVEVGSFSQTFQLVAKGAGFAFKDANLAFSLKPRLKGSSRGSFKLKLAKTTLAGVIDPNAEIELALRAEGLPGARGRIRLTGGGYTLGRVRGALLAPAFFPSKATVSANAVKPDVVTLTGGFAWDGATPASLGTVRVAVGSTFVRSVPGASFTRSGDAFAFSEKTAADSFSVVLDFARAVVTVKAKGAEVGTLAGTTTEISLDAGTGAGRVAARVILGTSGTKRLY